MADPFSIPPPGSLPSHTSSASFASNDNYSTTAFSQASTFSTTEFNTVLLAATSTPPSPISMTHETSLSDFSDETSVLSESESSELLPESFQEELYVLPSQFTRYFGDAEEAACLLGLIRARRNACRAKKDLAEYRMKESLHRAKFYHLQSAKAMKGLQKADSDIGRVRLAARAKGWPCSVFVSAEDEHFSLPCVPSRRVSVLLD